MTEDASTLALDDEIVEAITAAPTEHNALTVAYIGADGWAHVSKRGSAQVLDTQTLGLWARKPDTGLAVAIGDNPHITLLYVDFATRGVMYTFYGRARISDSDETTEQIWNTMPGIERDLDPERAGAAVIIALDKIDAVARRPERNFTLQR